MEQNCKTRQVNEIEWEKFLNTTHFQFIRGMNASKILSTEELKCTNESELGMTHITRTKPHYFVCIESIKIEKRNIFLIQEEEKDLANNSVLLYSGECETSGLQWNNIIEFFNGQIEADERAFRSGIIQDPIYEMLRTVSKLIENCKKEFSITFMGKRSLFYHNKMTENTINVNPEDGWFVLNNSKTRYNEYIPTLSKKSLLMLDIRRRQRLKYADRLDSDLATIAKSGKIKETWGDCELSIYIGRDVTKILCGRGEETKKRIIINKVGNEITVQEDPHELKK